MYSDLTYQLHFKNPESTEFLRDDFLAHEEREATNKFCS